MSSKISPELGWQPFFQQQLNADEWNKVRPARVIEQHKSKIQIILESGETLHMPVTGSMPSMTVGDWVLLESDGRILRVMERQSCFRRKAAGHRVSEQLLAANVDTAFIVCSLNDDFSLNRIERYLSVVNDAGATPVVVLTKKDLCDQANEFAEQVQGLDNMLSVELVNSKDPQSTAQLLPWCVPGKTLVMLGSSGAGKSTLTNALLGEERQEIGAIRQDDDKGRHTTTHRSLLSTPSGAMIIDTPGMRELQLAECEAGVATTFADIMNIAVRCRFTDCSHESEPKCAVRAAVESGELDSRRFENYKKLEKEQAFNAASMLERRTTAKATTQYQKRVQSNAKKHKGH